MAKLTMKAIREKKTIPELFEMFLLERESLGISPATLKTYRNKLHACSCFYNLDIPIEEFTQDDVVKLTLSLKKGVRLDGSVSNVRESTIASYLIGLKAFFAWCKEKEYSNVFIPLYKFEAEPKEVYTNEEIKKLIKKPNMKKCTFCEYRNWVIVCFLCNCGCRSATLRNIQIRDLDFDSDMILFRHMKAKNTQYVPMGREMKKVLIEYLRVRQGKPEDYLFPSQNNTQLSENALKLAIEDYNHSRGVAKTSILLFRHYYAKSYIQNGGDCFRLQKILGHKKIEMTLHYVNLYATDTKKGFDDYSPLSVLSAQDKRIKMR